MEHKEKKKEKERKRKEHREEKGLTNGETVRKGSKGRKN